nr:methyltransferase [Candidatus Freyarchaeota archaeon]
MGEKSESGSWVLTVLSTLVGVLFFAALVLAFLYNPLYFTYINQIQSFEWISWVYPAPFELIRYAAWTTWLYNPAAFELIRYAAWTIWAYIPAAPALSLIVGLVLLCVSGILSQLPILTFMEKGGVPEGKSFFHTTKFVDSGIYAIIRHPQYTGGAILCLIPIFLGLHWLVTLIAIASAPIWYLFARIEDKTNVEKFGEAYERYKQSVPAMNFLLGAIRLRRRKRREQKQ